MPFTTLGFENTQSTIDSFLLESVGVGEDLWENIKTMSSFLRHYQLIEDHKIIKLIALKRSASCGLLTHIEAFSQHHCDGHWDLRCWFFWDFIL